MGRIGSVRHRQSSLSVIDALQYNQDSIAYFNADNPHPSPEVGNINKPFGSLQDAVDACSSGMVVVMLSSTLGQGVNLKNGVNIHSLGMSINGVVSDNGAAVSCIISANAVAIECTNATSVIEFRGDLTSGSTQPCVTADNMTTGKITIHGNINSTSSASCLSNADNVTVYGNITSNTGIAINTCVNFTVIGSVSSTAEHCISGSDQGYIKGNLTATNAVKRGITSSTNIVLIGNITAGGYSIHLSNAIEVYGSCTSSGGQAILTSYNIKVSKDVVGQSNGHPTIDDSYNLSIGGKVTNTGLFNGACRNVYGTIDFDMESTQHNSTFQTTTALLAQTYFKDCTIEGTTQNAIYISDGSGPYTLNLVGNTKVTAAAATTPLGSQTFEADGSGSISLYGVVHEGHITPQTLESSLDNPIPLTKNKDYHINGGGGAITVNFDQTPNTSGRVGGVITIYNTTGVTFSDNNISPTGLGGITVSDIGTIVYSAYNGKITSCKVADLLAYDITSPTISTVTITGTSMVVVFTEAVNGNGTTGLSFDGDLSAITVDSLDSGSGTDTLTYTLSASADPSDVGSLVYTGSGITDLNENELADGSTSATIVGGDYTSNLIGLYLGEDDATDSSGQGNDLTVTGTLNYSVDASEGTKAFDVPGSTQGLLPYATTDGFTFIADVKCDLSQVDASIGDVLFGNNASGVGFRYISLKQDGSLTVAESAGTTNTTSAGVVTTNTYARIALTYDTSGNLKVYVDSVEVGSFTGYPTSWSKTMKLWKSETFNGTSYTGLMDNVKIYDRVLTQTDITAEYLS